MMFGVRLFRCFQTQMISEVLRLAEAMTFANALGIFLGLFEVSWGLKGLIIFVLGLSDTSEKPEIMKMRVCGFSHKQIEKL